MKVQTKKFSDTKEEKKH